MKSLQKQMRRFWRQTWPVRYGALVGVVVVVGALIALGVVHYRAQATPQAQMRALVRQIGAIYLLPTNEQPTLATVSDATAVRKQPFFIHANKGDKVLIYANNKLAVLYRPSEHKIINVGPINGVVSYATFTMTIRNGTAQPQLTDMLKSKLTASFVNGKIVQAADAQRQNYPTTIVIPVNPKDADLAAQIADALQAQVGNLPIGEAAPGTDILIIIGQDYKP